MSPTIPADPRIVAEGLRKRFHDPKRGAIEAVAGVDLVAEPGRVTGLLGVNGAGKTTLLRILATVLRPDSGRASVAGHDVLAEPAQVRASIGFLSASTALYGRLTAREALEYHGGLFGLEGAALRQRLDSAVERFGLAPFLDQLCDRLSTGQKQRVSISRAILHDPPVLFFDEPTAGLDVVNAQTVMEFIEECRGQGKTVVFSTHVMSEAERLCDEVHVIHEGTIKGRGTVAELLAETGQERLESAFLSLVGYKRGAA
jgi:sodium transport system ATP-binding protein